MPSLDNALPQASGPAAEASGMADDTLVSLFCIFSSLSSSRPHIDAQMKATLTEEGIYFTGPDYNGGFWEEDI